MPTYEYKCRKCGHTFEAFQSITADPLSKCPKCKSPVRRVINGGMGVIFKGSGFYSTDNKRGSALTGGNGSSRDKEKPAEKPKETSSDSSTKTTTASAEKTPAS
jgi:putative FmdB family regulatory protein